MTDRRFVVGVDGSAAAQEALIWASRLATMLGAKLVVTHAVGLLEGHQRAKLLDVIGYEWCAQLPRAEALPEIVVRDGHPVDVLVDVVHETHAELLVVGSRGTGDRPALALGSTSLHLLEVAPCPVLVVPDRDLCAPHRRLQRILLAVDGSDGSADAVDYTCDLAAACHAWVDIVHAVNEVDVFPLGPATTVSAAGEWDALHRATGQLEPLRRHISRRGVPVHLRVELGTPEGVIADAAAAVDADLVVLASRHTGKPNAALLDSVSRQVARIAHRPTLVLPVSPPATATRDPVSEPRSA